MKNCHCFFINIYYSYFYHPKQIICKIFVLPLHCLYHYTARLTCPKQENETDLNAMKAWLMLSEVTRQRRPARGAYAHRSAATLAGESRAPAWCPNTPAWLHPSTLSHKDPCPAREYSVNYHNSTYLGRYESFIADHLMKHFKQYNH